MSARAQLADTQHLPANHLTGALSMLHSNLAKPDLTKQHLPLARTEIMQKVVDLVRADGRPACALAELAKIDYHTICKWLDGTTVNGRLSTIERVLRVLGYKLDAVRLSSAIQLTNASSGYH